MIPILAEPIDNLKEGVVYYPDIDFWYSPGNFSGSGKEKLVKTMITNYLNNEGYDPAGIYI